MSMRLRLLTCGPSRSNRRKWFARALLLPDYPGMVVIDASPLTHLARIQQPDLLKQIYSDALIGPAVYAETVEAGMAIDAPDGQSLEAAITSGWLLVRRLRKTLRGTRSWTGSAWDQMRQKRSPSPVPEVSGQSSTTKPPEMQRRFSALNKRPAYFWKHSCKTA